VRCRQDPTALKSTFHSSNCLRAWVRHTSAGWRDKRSGARVTCWGGTIARPESENPEQPFLGTRRCPLLGGAGRSWVNRNLLGTHPPVHSPVPAQNAREAVTSALWRTALGRCGRPDPCAQDRGGGKVVHLAEWTVGFVNGASSTSFPLSDILRLPGVSNRFTTRLRSFLLASRSRPQTPM
jgi:hypothetical protein